MRRKNRKPQLYANQLGLFFTDGNVYRVFFARWMVCAPSMSASDNELDRPMANKSCSPMPEMYNDLRSRY